MTLVCFLCKKTLDDRIDHEYCCDNCIYDIVEAGQVPDFKVYNITTKLDIIYVHTTEYSDLLFSNEYERLLAKNLRSPHTIVDQTYTCEEVLNNFALQT